MYSAFLYSVLQFSKAFTHITSLDHSDNLGGRYGRHCYDFSFRRRNDASEEASWPTFQRSPSLFVVGEGLEGDSPL